MTASSSQARRAELAAFLRATRNRLRPDEAGLPAHDVAGRRRAPGLRREEVARMSGVSLTWYTWLEQGRDVSPSAQVIDALARTLKLTPDQHRHVRQLAGLSMPESPGPVSEAIPRLQRLVDIASPSPACVYDRHFDYLAWNDSYTMLLRDPALLPPARRNLLWAMFADAGPGVSEEAAFARHSVLGHFRAAAARSPDDPRFAWLVGELSRVSPEFQRMWADYPVHRGPGTVTIEHPSIGRIAAQVHTLHPDDEPDLLLVLQIPCDPADRRAIARLLQHRG